MKNVYEHCPICGKTIEADENICNDGGFVHVEIDMEGNKDIDVIHEEQKRRKMKVWTIKPIAVFVILFVLSVVFSYIISTSVHENPLTLSEVTL